MKGWKIQKFLGDVVYDLRSRNLLPVAILLIAAIVAVPFLISRSSGDDVPAGPPNIQSAAKVAPENQAAALAYAPGVRNYRERLGDLSAKNPFRQQFAGPAETATEEIDDALESIGGGDTGDIVPTGGGDQSSSGGGGTTTTETGKWVWRQYYYETDVLVGESGLELARRNRIQAYQTLPSDEAPVLVFLGITGGDQAVFLVSTDVNGIGGEGTCYPTPEKCQLLGLKQGGSAELIYGADGKTYKIEVARIKVKVKKTTSKNPPKQIPG